MAIMPRYTSSDIAVATPQGQFRDVSAPFDQLSAQMDRMTGFFIQEAKQQAIVQAEEYAADKAPTIQQIEEARRLNQPIAPIADKTTIFGRAANEAQSRILAKNVAAAADMQMAQLQQDVSAGKVSVNDIANQTNALIKGYSSALAEVDPMIARSLEADLALSGNRLFVSATKAAAAEAAAKQQQAITDSINASVPIKISQILSAGPVTTAGPRGEPYQLDEVSQIKAVLEQAENKISSLPASKQKQARKDLRTALKEGAERYGERIVLSGGVDDLRVLEAQIRGGKFNFAITDPKDLNTLVTKVTSRINAMQESSRKQLKINQKVINQTLDDKAASILAGNYSLTGLPSREDINENIEDPVERALAIRKLDSIQTTANAAFELEYKSKSARDLTVEIARREAIDEDSKKKYEALKSINDTIDQQVKKDPAQYSQRFAEVQTAWENFMTAKKEQADRLRNGQTFDPYIVSKAASEYTQAVRMRQEEAGVLPGDVKYFNKEWVEKYKDMFNNQLQSGINVADYFMNESQFWGDAWPDLVKQMNIGTELLIISNMSSSLESRRGAQKLAIASQPQNKKALEDVFSADKKNIVQSVSGYMDDFRLSLRSPAIQDGAIIEQAVLDSSVLLTMAYMQDGMSMPEASKKATNEIFNNQYGFAAGFRVPKTLGINLSTPIIEENANFIKANIDYFKDQILIPPGLTSKSQGITPEEEADLYFDSLRNFGGFVNTSDDRFGVRMIDATGNPVRFKSGAAFEITWDQLNKGSIAELPSEVETRSEAQKANYMVQRNALLASYGIKSPLAPIVNNEGYIYKNESYFPFTYSYEYQPNNDGVAVYGQYTAYSLEELQRIRDSILQHPDGEIANPAQGSK
jgi:ribosomal protein S17E